VQLDTSALRALGVKDVLEVASARDDAGRCVYDPGALVAAVSGIVMAAVAAHSFDPVL
jgi:hypothetical protein